MKVNEEKRDTALILASSRRSSELAISDAKPCRICKLPDSVKGVVEGLLGTGLALRPIVDVINEMMQVIQGDDWMNVSTRTLELQRKNHLPVRLYMQRVIIEKQAERASKDVVSEDGSLLNPLSYAELMMNAGGQNLINNPELVSPMEGLAAAKTLHDFDQNDNSQMEIAKMASDLNKIILAVKAVCSPPQIQTIVSMMNADSDDPGRGDIDVI